MNTYQQRISMPTAAQVAAALGAKRYGEWYRTAGFCHGKTARSNTTLAFRDSSDGYIWVECFASCTDGEGWRTVRDELLRRAGYDPGRFAFVPPTATAPVSPKPAQNTRQDPVDAILDALVSVPNDPNLPARLWAATKEKSKQLVAADSRFPASIGWIDRAGLLRVSQRGNSPAHRMHRGFRGAGALVIPLAPISAWNGRLRPSREDIRGVQLIHLGADGGKHILFAGDSGSDKRSIRRAGGDTGLRGCVGLLHMPEDSEGAEVNLAEGLADALAVLRYGRDVQGQIVGMVVGTSGFLGLGYSDLGFASRVRLWVDSDDSGDGRTAAGSLAQRLANAGLKAALEMPPRGSDPASAPLRADCPGCGRGVSPSDMTDSGVCRGCAAVSGR
ncbi:MAG: hypothetical protein OXC95_12370 [Dehalococcoidia bacterium]|nr:hypothetical protein [Dehalococcoidia bacterium]